LVLQVADVYSQFVYSFTIRDPYIVLVTKFWSKLINLGFQIPDWIVTATATIFMPRGKLMMGYANRPGWIVTATATIFMPQGKLMMGYANRPGRLARGLSRARRHISMRGKILLA
jgi:hypothetical protein